MNSNSNRNQRTRCSQQTLTFQRLEKRELKTTFFIDAANGDDSNPGTAEQPLASYLPIVWAYDQSDPNVGRIDLQAGDEVVFRAGTYSDTFQNPPDRNNGTHRGLYLRGLNGTEDNPIVVRAEEGVVINPSPADGSEHFSVDIAQSEHIHFSGFEITGLGTGIFVSESSDIKIFNNWIHDIDGAAIDNLSGINLTANDGLIEVYDNLFHDIYDRINGTSENSRAFVAFNNEGSDIRVFNNTVFNSVPIDAEFSGGGIITKHGSDSQFSIQYNVIDQVRNEAIGTSNPNTTIANNLILRSDGVSIRDFGGPAFFNNITVENNSFIQTDHALQYNPTDTWYPNGPYDDIGTLRFLNNLVDDQGAQAIDQGTLAIGLGPGTDSQIAESILREGNLELDGNIYSHIGGDFNAVLFSYLDDYERNYSFADWQASGFDLAGRELDFELDSFFSQINTGPTEAGWLAGEDSRLTVFATDSEGAVIVAPQVIAGQVQTFTLVRSGDDRAQLNNALTVELSSSSGLLQLPRTVTFQPGQTHLEFQATADGDGLENGERAIRISANAQGTSNNVDAWIRVSGLETVETEGSNDTGVEDVPRDTDGTIVFSEDFEDGTIEQATYLPQNDRLSGIVETEDGGHVYQITYEQDEFSRKVEWIGEESFDSIDVSYRTRLIDGLPIGESQRQWIDLKTFRVFEDSGALGEVFTTHVDRYSPGFENQGFDHVEILHTYGNDVKAVRIPVDGPLTDWIDFRYHMSWNTPGNADGVLMIWHDGELVFEDHNVTWFENNDTLRPNGFWFGGNVSGGNAGEPIAPFRRQFDNVEVSVNGNTPSQTASSDNSAVSEPNGSATVTEDGAGDMVEVDSTTPTAMPEDQLVNVPIEEDDLLAEVEPEFPIGIVTLPGESGDIVSLNFQWLQRFAEYDNELGFFIADDAAGTIAGISANSADYTATALSHSSRQVVFESGEGVGAETQFAVPAGSNLVFYLIQNATTARFLEENSQNQIDSGPLAFFSIARANPDQFMHVRVDQTEEGTWSFGWEDLLNGGDQSFTDAVIELGIQIETNLDTTPNQPPELVLPNTFVAGEPRELTVGENAHFEFGVTNTDFLIEDLTFRVDVADGNSRPDLPTISAEGVFNWNPTTSGEYRFNITVTDPNGLSNSELVVFVVTEHQVLEPDNPDQGPDTVVEESPADTGSEENMGDGSDLSEDETLETPRSFVSRIWSFIEMAFASERFRFGVSRFFESLGFLRR